MLTAATSRSVTLSVLTAVALSGPDLLEEMEAEVYGNGGQAVTVREPPFRAAARLRYPDEPEVRR